MASNFGVRGVNSRVQEVQCTRDVTAPRHVHVKNNDFLIRTKCKHDITSLEALDDLVLNADHPLS